MKSATWWSVEGDGPDLRPGPSNRTAIMEKDFS